MADALADSPKRHKHTHSAEYRSSDVTSSRVTPTRSIPVVPEVTLDHLMCTVLAPIGRGTRVWRVRELVGKNLVGPEYVLKDTWVHAGREAEHLTFKKVQEEQGTYAEYFLTSLDYGFVPLDHDLPSVLDRTNKVLSGQRNLRPTEMVLILRKQSSSLVTLRTKSLGTGRDSVGRFDGVPSSSKTPEDFCDFGRLSKCPRQHCRIVFKETGTPVHDLRKLTDVFTAIQGGWRGLHAIHLSNHVHRDISSGNILLAPASGGSKERGVLMDIEYAKNIHDTSQTHDVKTGTAAFMATEVAAMKHERLLLDRLSKRSTGTQEAIDSLMRRRERPALRTPTPPLPPFRHNPLHDMESIWWLCLWAIFYLVPARESVLQHHMNYCELLKDPDPATKHSFISREDVYLSLTTHIPEASRSIMELWSRLLNCRYSMCYEKHDDPATRLDSICVDSSTIEVSYQDGEELIKDLIKEASNSLSDLVPLPERMESLDGNVAPLRSVTTRKSLVVFNCVELRSPRSVRA